MNKTDTYPLQPDVHIRPIPARLLKKIIKERIKENLEKESLRNNK